MSQLHLWSLGNGVVVQVTATQPLSVENYRMMAKYVALATEAAEIAETPKPFAAISEGESYPIIS